MKDLSYIHALLAFGVTFLILVGWFSVRWLFSPSGPFSPLYVYYDYRALSDGGSIVVVGFKAWRKPSLEKVRAWMDSAGYTFARVDDMLVLKQSSQLPEGGLISSIGKDGSIHSIRCGRNHNDHSFAEDGRLVLSQPDKQFFAVVRRNMMNRRTLR